MRDTEWTARGVKEAVEIRKNGAYSMNRDGGHHQLPTIVLQAAGEEDVTSSSALMMQIDRVQQN